MARAQTAASPTFFNVEALRQCHALEHGTVWVLSEKYPQLRLGGTSTDKGFYIFGAVEPQLLEAAAHEALRRFKAGEDTLAVHPRCGTNLSVGLVLTLALSMGFNLVLPRRPLSQLMGAGLAVYGAAILARDLGALAQKHVTTAVPLNLAVLGVVEEKDWLGRTGYFVQVAWVHAG